MKAVAIALAAMMYLFFISTEAVQAQINGSGNFYCKSNKIVKNLKYCKENGGRM